MTGTLERSIDLGKLSPGLGAVCAGYLSTYRSELEAALRRGSSGVALCERHARVLDGLLGALFCATDAAARKSGRAPQGRIALVAVGGYGRGLVGLHSDVDVAIVCDDPTDPQVAAVAEGLLYPLWDVSLAIGHSVRGVDDTLKLSREDIQTATTLLDLRKVAGDVAIVDELVTASRRHFLEGSLIEFIDRMTADSEARHERFGGSLYLLEPEVKLGKGGLRDLDVLSWAARARFGGRTFEDLLRLGALLPRERAALESAREMLWRVRNLLHLRAGRRQDRLTFADQEEIAVALGFADGPVGGLGVEQFMQAYYRHAHYVARTVERVVDRATELQRKQRGPTDDLGDGTIVFDGQVTLRHSDELEADPALALRLYRQVVRTGYRPYGFARDVISRHAGDSGWAERLRASPEANGIFLSLLSHVGVAPVRRGSILGELHEVGLMLAMIPEFEPVTGRVQHDVYHVYTVDVHSVAAVDRLREIFRGDRITDMALATRLAAEHPRPMPLFLGLLLHDIGKAHGRDHSRKGAAMARPIAERFGLEPGDVDHVVWLVEEHLSLYHWAVRRDTTDPETIAEIQEKVRGAERWRDLFLLTVADLSTTNPNAMTSWKANMLEGVYLSVAAHMDGAPGTAGSARAAAMREVLREVNAVAGELADSMPDRYLLSNPRDAVLRHAELVQARDRERTVVGVAQGPSDEIGELVVATVDRPGLLADITAVLAGNRLDVETAQIYTRNRLGEPEREALDIFHVRPSSRQPFEIDAALAGRIRADLEAVMAGRSTPSELLSRLPKSPTWAERKVPHVRTEVAIDNAVSPRFTVIDVFTRDRTGLLHTIAHTLHEQGLSIALSKISTEGARAADVFYVQDEQGGKITSEDRMVAVSDALKSAIARFHAQWDLR